MIWPKKRGERAADAASLAPKARRRTVGWGPWGTWLAAQDAPAPLTSHVTLPLHKIGLAGTEYGRSLARA